MLAAFGYEAFSLPLDIRLRLVCAILVPVSLAVVWGLFFAPKARRRLPMPWLLIAKLVLFAGSVVALLITGRPSLAWPYAALIAINFTGVVLWKQY